MISTLDEFFNAEKNDDNKNLFDGLYISKSKYKVEQGKYPVINLNFKSLKADSWDIIFDILKEEFRMLFESKSYLQSAMTEKEKELYNRFVGKEATQGEYELSIKILSQILERYYNQKVVLLIDEYDVPIQTGYTKGFYNDIIGFIKNLFGNALKTNNSIQFAVMTGILRVSKESIFIDLNNVKVYSVVENKYDEFFGFNEKETTELLKHYGYELTGEVKRMYDGYIFGNQEIYNPWSILNYVEDGQLYPYWVNTSADELLRQLFEGAKDKTGEMLEELVMGKSVKITYNEKITFLDLEAAKSKDAVDVIGNFLLFSGYLTKADKNGIGVNDYIELKIPNNEVRVVYKNIIMSWTVQDADLTEKAEQGKQQIKENEYHKELELDKVQKIITYSVAFRGKKCKVI